MNPEFYDVADFLFGSWILSGCFEADGSVKEGCTRCHLHDARALDCDSRTLAYALKQMNDEGLLPGNLSKKLRFDRLTCLNLDEVFTAATGLLSPNPFGPYEVIGMTLTTAKRGVGDGYQLAIEFGHALRKKITKLRESEND